MTSSPVVGDPGVEYLDRARSDEFFGRLKAESVEMLAIEPGNRVLDVGCGTGDDAAAMSAVASDVFSLGVDLSSRNVIEAQQRHGRTGVAFVIADCHALPIRSSCLDGCRAERTLQHIVDAGLVVVEIGRALRPGGRVVFSEPDWPSCVLAGASESVSEQVLRHWIRGRNSNPIVGRNLPGLSVDAGLEPVGLRCDSVIYRSLDEVEGAGAFPLRRAADQAAVDGVIEERTADTWIADLVAASGCRRFVFSVLPQRVSDIFTRITRPTTVRDRRDLAFARSRSQGSIHAQPNRRQSLPSGRCQQSLYFVCCPLPQLPQGGSRSLSSRVRRTSCSSCSSSGPCRASLRCHVLQWDEYAPGV